MASLSATLPQPMAPVVDPSTGIITPTWWYYFQRIFARTGGGTGGQFGPAATISVGPSPFVFAAPSSGFVILSGGGATQIRFSQDGTSWLPVGSFYASHPMTAGSFLEVTYARAPRMTFIPG